MQIIPSILVSDEKTFIKQIKDVQESVDSIQLDIADGKFVPSKTWANPNVVEKYTKINVELHLMVADPIREMDKWTATEVVKRVLFHYEAVNNHREIINKIKNQGWEAGMVINPDTDVDLIEPYLAELESVIFMGVHPGKQGQGLIPEVLEKMIKFDSLYPGTFTEIDGGVNENTLPAIIKTGVKAICPGSAIFGNEQTPTKNINHLKSIINKLTS